MFNKKEKNILYFLLVAGIIALPLSLFRKGRKDWLIVFFLKGVLSSLINTIAVASKRLEYPVRLFPRLFKTSVIFDYLLFPLACVWFNQTTCSSKLRGIFMQAFFAYSLPMALLEYWIVKTTKLIKYKKWSSLHTYFSLSFTFLFVRGFIGLVRKASKDT